MTADVTSEELGRRILRLLRLEPGHEFLVVQTRDGSIIVKRPHPRLEVEST